MIRAARLGTLITIADGAPMISHVPMLFDENEGPHGTLLCHVSRANEQWRAIGAGSDAVVVFLEPDAYITPNWYASKREHGKVVPTWNYIAVHAYGTATTVEQPRDVRKFVERLTRKHEGDRADPWHVTDAPEPYIEAQLRGIVGIEIAVQRFDAKWKLGQNRPEADTAGVIAGLDASADAMDRAVADEMRAESARRRR